LAPPSGPVGPSGPPVRPTNEEIGFGHRLTKFMSITTHQDTKCRLGSKCRNINCPYTHPSPPGFRFSEAGPNPRNGAKCSQSDCKYAHAAARKIATTDSLRVQNFQGQNPSNSQHQTVISLLHNFQDMFGVTSSWIDELSASLAEPSCKLTLILVDLDNVPRFFEQITHRMIARMPFETFIVCSANSTRHAPWKSVDRVHFSLANHTKDSADAICTMAAAKLDSILVAFGRQHDVPLFIVSDDQIFGQVHRRPISIRMQLRAALNAPWFAPLVGTGSGPPAARRHVRNLDPAQAGVHGHPHAAVQGPPRHCSPQEGPRQRTLPP
jgi:hypothetical protein